MKSLSIPLLLLVINSSASANLEVELGISEEEFLAKVDAVKVTENMGHSHGYSDFMEVNPEVYVDERSSDRKFEYYFYEGKLYKTFTIYRTRKNVKEFYQSKIDEMVRRHGNPIKQYTSEIFSMPIEHNVWNFGENKLDLRFGAGYVYEVLVNKPIQTQKHKDAELHHAI